MEILTPMVKRLLGRTVVYLLMIGTAFLIMKPLTIWLGWPEIMLGLSAAAKMGFVEISIMWFRIVTSPRLDMQTVAAKVEKQFNPVAQAILYCAYAFQWAVRMALFVYIAWVA